MCNEPPSGRGSNCQCVSWQLGEQCMSAEALEERVGQHSLVDLLARVLAKVDHWPHSSAPHLDCGEGE